LVKLTPPRTEKLVRALVARSQESEETELRELVERNIASLATIHSDLVVDIDQISSMLPILKEQRWRIYPLIQKLYERKILLRGKSFPCPHCKTILWYPLESIREENRCYGCNQYVSIPIFSGERVSGDHFKLNELMSNAVDQGLLPLILTVYFLSRQKFYMKRFIYNYEVHPLDYDEMLAEIDLIFTLGNRLGLSETKADRGFTSHQVDRLLDLANRMEADILLFSTLKGMDSEEVQSLVDYLRSKDLKIPAFIITREVLFEQSLVDLGPYFEVKRGDTRFPHGPIVIKIGKSV